ncbi:MAG: hypothetical protein CYPHOPRED_001688 [Cyphobasidiales sp. Tagirdzhanova-0007]|nr:MAG: hypothetical protein CYPHOPRED_001688 [Cyphobasidiales sp. Tagirdzhanova-0007]
MVNLARSSQTATTSRRPSDQEPAPHFDFRHLRQLRPSRPRSVHELVQAASYSFDPRNSLVSYVRGVEDLRRQALVYESEGDIETAFILLTRCARLALEDIPRHHDFGHADKALSKQLIKTSKSAMDSLKNLKSMLKQQHEAWQSSELAAATRQFSSATMAPSLSQEPYEGRDAGYETRGRLSTKREESAKKRAQEDSPEPLSPAYMPISYFDSRTIYPRIDPSVDSSAFTHSTTSSSSTLYIPYAGAQVPSRIQRESIPTSYTDSPFSASSQTYAVPPSQYPLQVSHSNYTNRDAQSTQHPLLNQLRRQPRSSLSRLRPEDNSQQSFPAPAVPPRPLPHPDNLQSVPGASSASASWQRGPNASMSHAHRPLEREKTDPSRQPQGQRSASMAPSNTFKPLAARTEAGLPLRSLILPAELVSTFATLASKNTRRNLETCALICGKLSRNIFTATLLCVPKQSATSDTCTTKNEEDIFQVTENRDVLVLGWIHTHPRQTCFLSSLDLHTHFSYQQMLPEAIAIVVAPTASPSVGIFRITDPPGLSIIGNCEDKAIFHPHVNAPIYTDAAGYHVWMAQGLRLEVVDVR